MFRPTPFNVADNNVMKKRLFCTEDYELTEINYCMWREGKGTFGFMVQYFLLFSHHAVVEVEK